MPSFDLAASAFALGVERKWLDNVLSHHEVEGTTRVRQGIQRRLGPATLLRIAVSKLLIEHLRLPISRALQIAQMVCASGTGEGAVAPGLAVRVDVGALERGLTMRLREAAELIVPVRRGRPPKRRRSLADT